MEATIFKNLPTKCFSGGGPKKPAMPANETNFDVLIVGKSTYIFNSLIGGLNATSLIKFLQADGVDYKMALVTDRSRYILPEVYFTVCHGHVRDLKLESATVSA